MSEHTPKILELDNLIQKGQDDPMALIAAGNVIDDLLQLSPGTLTKEDAAHFNSCFVRLVLCVKPELKVANLVRALLKAE